MTPKPLPPRGIKTSVEIRDDLYRAAKVAAISVRGGLRAVIEAALELYLSEKKALPAKKKPARP